MAFGTRLQRRRKYGFEGGKDWAKVDEDVCSRMVQMAPPLCSGSVFAVFFLLAYRMMMPKYKRQIFLASHLFCIISMLSLSVYAVIILVDVLKFPHGSIGILDGILNKEVTVLNEREGLFHDIVPRREWNDILQERKKNFTYSCCGAYASLIDTIMHREEAAFLRYYHNDSTCDNETADNEEMLKFEHQDCKFSESCFYKDAAVYGNRVVLFLIFTMASTLSAGVTVWKVIRRDREEQESEPPRDESIRRTEIHTPAIPVVISKPTTPTEPSPINIPQLQ